MSDSEAQASSRRKSAGQLSMEREGLSWSSLLGMGISIAATVVVGLLLGWLVDKALGTSPVFLMVGLAVGIVGAATYMIIQFRHYLASDSTVPHDPPSDQPFRTIDPN